MADIELDDFVDREEEETKFDDDWRDESILDIDPGASVRGGLEAERRADRELGVGLGLKNRANTEEKKNLLRELKININKGNSPSARSLFKRLKLTVNRKGKVNGSSRTSRRLYKLNEFNSLAMKAKEEHKTTAVALMEETVDVTVDNNLADSVLRSSLERLNEEISEKAEDCRGTNGERALGIQRGTGRKAFHRRTT